MHRLNMKKTSLFILFFLYSLSSVNANNYFWYNISNYDVHEYFGDIQNWGGCIDQSGRLIYIANNSGLLNFDGNNWTLYTLPHNETLRAAHQVGNRIYTAGDNCIGYWKKNEIGKLEYTSLQHLITPPMVLDDNYWSIASDDTSVYFQSFSQIIRYNGKDFQLLSKECHMLLQQCDKEVFVHRLFGGIYKLSNGIFHEVVPHKYLKDQEVKFFLKIKKGKYIFGTNTGHIYIKSDSTNEPEEWKYDSALSKPYVIDCATFISNQKLAIGTIGGGIYIYSMDGRLIEKIDKYSQLKSNTVHRLFYKANSLWATLDNGISHIKINPAICTWKSSSDIGNFHAAFYYNDHYYIGTNEGLFSSDKLNKPLSKVNGIGEVFSFKFVKGDLLCGTNNGCYRLEKGIWRHIAPIKGINSFQYIADNGSEYLVTCTYLYITYFKFNNDQWQLHKQISNLTNTFEQITPENIRLLWAIHPQKGVFKIRINDSLEKAEEVVQYKDRPGLTDYRRISIQRIDGITYFFSPDGVYTYSSDTDQFVLNNKITRSLASAKGFNWVAHAKENEYWVCRGHELFLYRINQNGAVEIGRESFLNYNLTQSNNKVYISHLKDDLYLFSSADGIVYVDAGIIKKTNHRLNNSIDLSLVTYYVNGELQSVFGNNQDQIDIPSNASNIRFMLYQSILSNSNLLKFKLIEDDNDDKRWSDWIKTGKIEFNQLLSGEHYLLIEDFWGNKKTIKINILAPFYLSKFAFVLYSLFILLAVFMLTRKRYQNKRNKILKLYQAEQRLKDEQIIKLTNERLQETVNAQRSEINNKLHAISQKQELLFKLSDELDRQKVFLGERYPRNLYIKLKDMISDGMTLDKDFVLIQNYYQDIHHDFLVLLKAKHPELSSQDLKFCCLIRSNLSTKDIAAVLNITQKSVELKKYRLKKKLDLQKSLSDYLLGI